MCMPLPNSAVGLAMNVALTPRSIATSLIDLLRAEHAVGGGERIGRHEVELDLPGRSFVAPRLPRDADPFEAAHDLVHERRDVVRVVRGVAERHRRAHRREVAILARRASSYDSWNSMNSSSNAARCRRGPRRESWSTTTRRTPRADRQRRAVESCMVDDDVRHAGPVRARDDRRQIGTLMHVAERGLAEVGPPTELGRATEVPREHEVGERGTERQRRSNFARLRCLPSTRPSSDGALGAHRRDRRARRASPRARPASCRDLTRRLIIRTRSTTPVSTDACCSDPIANTLPSSRS